MKDYWMIPIYVAIASLILPGCKKRNSPPPAPGQTPPPVSTTKAFDPRIARVVGRVYHMSNPLFDPAELRAYVQQNRAAFAENGPVIRCARLLGQDLFARSIRSFGQNDYNRAYGRALEMGATGEQARDVANSMQSGSLDLFVMGKELFWLSQVLPSAANGDWGPYETTGTQTRQAQRQVLPFLNQMMAQDAAMRGVVEAVGRQYQPIVEDQIVWLAIMTGVCK